MLKKKLVYALLLMALFSLAACGGGDDWKGTPYMFTTGAGVTFNIVNASGETLYMYNYPTLDKKGTQPVKLDPNPDKAVPLSLFDKPQVRIYFANSPLSKTLENGSQPDVFNYNSDATVTYSFMEYTYEASNSRYTVNLSYVDDFSYPITIKFTNVPDSYKGCVSGFEYGFTSLTAVKNALKAQTDYRWDALIWPAVVNTKWDSEKYPQNMNRIIGPNKVWPAATNDGPWVPDSYKAFVDSLPMTDYQLFGSSYTNWDGWQGLTQSSPSPNPSDTGYVKALHSVAKADKNGKYGFYCYPKDDQTNLFTYVPDTTTCTITVHPQK
jgi:hypothetical protein